MFGNGLKHLLILIPSMSIQKVIVLSDVVAVGGMRKRTVVCPEDMTPTIPKNKWIGVKDSCQKDIDRKCLYLRLI